MRFSVLGSGSRGNCVFIESGETALLIDAGFSGKETQRRLQLLGKSLDVLDAIFLTHEHGDHISGAGALSRRLRIPVFANAGTLEGGGKKLEGLFAVREFETGKKLAFQDVEISSFRISHDTLDPVGYVINNGGKSVGYCTDTGRASHLATRRLKGCNGLVLEFNHDEKMLRNGPYPLHLQQRIRSSHGHLANGDAAAFLKNLLHEKLSHVVLAHLSEANNLPKLAMREAQRVVCRESATRLHLARQSAPCESISL